MRYDCCCATDVVGTARRGLYSAQVGQVKGQLAQVTLRPVRPPFYL